MKRHNSLFLLSVLFFFAVFTSCMSIKPAATKSGNKYYETFYVDGGYMQYFVKPIDFINTENKEKMPMDLTFKCKQNSKDSVKINFSIYNPTLIHKVDSIVIFNPKNTVVCHDVELIYNQKVDDRFMSRFSIIIPQDKLQSLSKNADWNFNLCTAEKKMVYQPNGKSKKIISKLNDEIFQLY